MFVQGFAPVFPSSSITYLAVNRFPPFEFADNEGFVYLLRNYPHLVHLVILDLKNSTSVFEALAQDGMSPHLQELEIVALTNAQCAHAAAECETMISVLEARASHELPLQRFCFEEIGEVERDRLPPPMDVPRVRRLGSIVRKLSIREPRNRDTVPAMNSGVIARRCGYPSAPCR